MLESADTFGLSKMISFGNRSDVDEADMIWYAANDPQTKVIGLYVEGFGDGQKFINTGKTCNGRNKETNCYLEEWKNCCRCKTSCITYWFILVVQMQSLWVHSNKQELFQLTVIKQLSRSLGQSMATPAKVGVVLPWLVMVLVQWLVEWIN